MLDIMSEKYSCMKALQRGFHLHAGLYPSNTFEKQQFVCCRGAFVTSNETMQTPILIWNNSAVVELRPWVLCSFIKDIHLLQSDKALKRKKVYKNSLSYPPYASLFSHIAASRIISLTHKS